ncbi:MAG: hypothetical protein V4591_08790 [Bdellovibrionota bacterium]
MYFKKIFSTGNLLSCLLPIVAAISLVSSIATASEEPPNPTKDVAGGVGKGDFKPPEYAVLPTGKTLPEGIYRVQFITAYTFGNFGFDENKSQQKNGLNYARWMTGTQLEYGLTNKVSLAVGIPFVNSNHVNMDGSSFTSTQFYQKYYDKFVSELSTALVAAGAPCGSLAACSTFINNGGTLGVGTIVLPTGEQVVIDANSPIKNQIRSLVLAAATPANGASGLGDIQVGFLWNAISEDSPIRHVPLYFSIGGGFRLPTGNFDLPSAMRATGGDGTLITGGGTYDAISRWNLDYVAMPGVILSWQHQMEVSLTDANLGRSSMVNSSDRNTADASATQHGQTGDKVPNALKFSRKGIHQIGFLQAAWGVGNMSEKAKWLGLYTQAKYNIAAQAYLNNMPIYAVGDQFFLGDASMHSDTGYEQYYAAVFGTKLSGLPYMIPVELAAEFEYPFAGKNRLISPMNAQATLSVYF